VGSNPTELTMRLPQRPSRPAWDANRAAQGAMSTISRSPFRTGPRRIGAGLSAHSGIRDESSRPLKALVLGLIAVIAAFMAFMVWRG
jgi:hypothetical protein